jgi:hypothetical protein
MMSQRGLAGLQNVWSILSRVRSAGREAPTRPRWTRFIPPLLCGLLGDLCLVLLALRPRHDGGVGMLILAAIFAVAIGWELRQSLQPRRLGLIERRPIRTGGVEHPGFLVPFFPHLTMAGTFLVLFLLGTSLGLLISNVVDPIRYLHENRTGWQGFLAMNSFYLGLGGLGLGLWAMGKCLPELFSSQRGVAVLREGVWMRSGQIDCFFPWEAIEKVALVKLKLGARRSTLWAGIGVTSVEEVRTARRWRRWMKRRHARIGWHLLVPPLGFALTSAQISHLLRIYYLYPEERARIGTAEGLARLKAALQITAPQRAVTVDGAGRETGRALGHGAGMQDRTWRTTGAGALLGLVVGHVAGKFVAALLWRAVPALQAHVPPGRAAIRYEVEAGLAGGLTGLLVGLLVGGYGFWKRRL